MFNLRRLGTTAFLATTLMTSHLPFAHAMDQVDDERGAQYKNLPQYKKLPFTGMRVTPTNDGLSVEVSVEEELGSGFRTLVSSEEAETTINTLIKAYGELPDTEKEIIPFIKVAKRQKGRVVVKEKLNNIQDLHFRYLNSEEINKKLDLMLGTYTKAYTNEKENRAIQFSRAKQWFEEAALAQIEEEERVAEELAEQLRLTKFEQEKAELQAAIVRQQQENFRQQQEQELVNLRAQLALQEIAAQAEKERLEQENLRIQQEIAQAEFARQQQAQEQLIFGRPPERVAHNVNKETERLFEGFNDILGGKSWGHSRKNRKK